MQGKVSELVSKYFASNVLFFILIRKNLEKLLQIKSYNWELWFFPKSWESEEGMGGVGGDKLKLEKTLGFKCTFTTTKIRL